MDKQKHTRTTGAILDDGTMVELIYDEGNKTTAFATSAHGKWSIEQTVKRPGQPDLVPYRATNTLIANGVVRFPERPEEYGTSKELIAEIQSFIHRYVDLSPSFEAIAAHYVLFSWVYDAFNELPYLRVRGDYGSGKSRFLLIVGSLAYKPIFGSGASTISPIFHLLERFAGTLVIDEADFRFSDEKADLVKILNNGNVRGFPVLRSVAQKSGEYSPHAFHVFGPKIIASRGDFDDKALESRFITEEMGGRPIRRDIPINLLDTYEEEARALRNKLLFYRFRQRDRAAAKAELVDRRLDARLNQVFVPLLSVVEDENVQEAIKQVAKEHQERRSSERTSSIEARVVTALKALMDGETGIGVAVGAVADAVDRAFGEELERPITHKWIGGVIRTRLHLKTIKSNSRFIVPMKYRDNVEQLVVRYGIGAEDIAAIPDATIFEPIRDEGTSGTSGGEGVPNPWLRY